MSVTLVDAGVQSWAREGPIWNHERPKLPYGWEAENEQGAASLKHAAMRELLKDQSQLKPEMFEHVSWHIAKYLWDALGRCKKQTLFMWRLMATTYPMQFRQISPSYRLFTERPMELQNYYNFMNSDAYLWRAILSIGTVYASACAPDLVNIANIKNLVALEIGRGSFIKICIDDFASLYSLDDHIVRSWMELAKSSGALQHLRILKVYHQRHLTTAALRILWDLPQLQTVVAYQCDKIKNEFLEYEKPKDNTVMVEGWAARRLDWVWKDHGEDVALAALRPLADVYEDSLAPQQSGSLDEGHKPQALGLDIPIMEFQLPSVDHSNRNKVSYRARYEANEIVLFTRPAVAKRGQKRPCPWPNMPHPRHQVMERLHDRLAMISAMEDIL